jgi:hypothetical protein
MLYVTQLMTYVSTHNPGTFPVSSWVMCFYKWLHGFIITIQQTAPWPRCNLIPCQTRSVRKNRSIKYSLTHIFRAPHQNQLYHSLCDNCNTCLWRRASCSHVQLLVSTFAIDCVAFKISLGRSIFIIIVSIDVRNCIFRFCFAMLTITVQVTIQL